VNVDRTGTIIGAGVATVKMAIDALNRRTRSAPTKGVAPKARFELPRAYLKMATPRSSSEKSIRDVYGCA
jgi:hypothetical protein